MPDRLRGANLLVFVVNLTDLGSLQNASDETGIAIVQD